MSEIIKQQTIQDIYNCKLRFLNQIKSIQALEKETEDNIKNINGYLPFRIDYRYDGLSGKNADEKYIDRSCWSYLAKINQLYKYMLCTDYDKLSKELENFNFPEFNISNAEAWIDSLKDLIYSNVATLIKTVFNKITEDTYYTGSGYSSREKKKRNNNGIDKNFILTTYDYSNIFGYHYNPTITEDLEKVCYIMDGKTVPEATIKNIMRSNKVSEASNDYFRIKVHKNGNTHYWINDDSRIKLNFLGAEPGKIGENIKIKIISKHW